MALYVGNYFSKKVNPNLHVHPKSLITLGFHSHNHLSSSSEENDVKSFFPQDVVSYLRYSISDRDFSPLFEQERL